MLLKKSLTSKEKILVTYIKLNLIQILTMKKITKDIIKLFGRLDYLINNASKFYPTKINEVTDKVWLDTIDTNIKDTIVFI
jgi:pteridine reductase